MALSVGIVGLPNVGKSTVFNALTAGKAEAANYPFCTIDPNVGDRAGPRCAARAHPRSTSRPQKVIPAIVEIVDIAGLVKGASQGEGLGNKFLANIRETQRDPDDGALLRGSERDPRRRARSIRCATSTSSISSSRSPTSKTAEKRAQEGAGRARRPATRRPRPSSRSSSSVCSRTCRPASPRASLDAHRGRAQAGLRRGACSRPSPCSTAATSARAICPSGNAWSDAGAGARADGRRRRRRPVRQGRGRARRARTRRIAPSCSQSYGLAEPALATLARECYRLLGLQSYFTAGEKEVRAWTIRKGATAPEAAGVIHTDFEKGFIRAQVYTLDGSRSARQRGRRSRRPASCASRARTYVVAGRRHHALPVQRLSAGASPSSRAPCFWPNGRRAYCDRPYLLGNCADATSDQSRNLLCQLEPCERAVAFS